MNLDLIFQQAVTLHKNGRFHDAGSLYRDILLAQPDHSEANHNLGVVSIQLNQPEAALPHLLAALEANPSHGQYWVSYIDALFQANQLDTAREVLALAIQQGLEGEEVDALAISLKGETHPNLVNDEIEHSHNPSSPMQTVTLNKQPSAQPPKTKTTHKKKSSHKESTPSPQAVNTLISLYNAGNIADALPQAEAMTLKFPHYWIGWKMLGVLLNQLGRSEDALLPMQKTVLLSPGDAEAHNNLGITLNSLGRIEEAVSSYRSALKINPSFVQAHSNLGVSLHTLGRLNEAEACYKKALQLNPAYIKAYINLGATLHDMGRLDEAESYYRRALEIAPDVADAHFNLGCTLKEMGRLNEAELSFRHALKINPTYIESWVNLGAVLQNKGQWEEAEACYQRALQIKPDFVDALNHLAFLLNAQDKSFMALGIIKQSLAINDTIEVRHFYVDCIKHLRFMRDDLDVRTDMVRALTEPWCRPSEITRVCIDLIKLTPDVGDCIIRANFTWPMPLTTPSLFMPNDLALLGRDKLFCALLDSAPICDVAMERFLTLVRRAMLEDAQTSMSTEPAICDLKFYAALARQCFINEYVFIYADEEIQLANTLRESLVIALENNSAVDALLLLAVASYFPLYAIPHSYLLLERVWPGEIMAVLIQQVREPAEEVALRSTIPQLTTIDDQVSLLVQHQYEANPYPRWVKTAPSANSIDINGYLRKRFPFAAISCKPNHDNTEILIAGCGTGQHSISTAQQISNANILAVDLSLSSLSYAKRKTLELGLGSIEYAHADILKLGTLNRSFDVIESSGVLHHLADPWAGWQVLLSLLRPNGVMKLGFYSAVARQNINQIRAYIAEHSYKASNEDIRRCRQDLLNQDKNVHFKRTLESPDFFSISTCRDMLFHVQEHCMKLSEISAFLNSNNLEFLGFEIAANVLNAYKIRFPNDHAALNLQQWQIFEDENPETFFGMYQFWIQKIS